jgi:hypothetical protein
MKYGGSTLRGNGYGDHQVPSLQREAVPTSGIIKSAANLQRRFS